MTEHRKQPGASPERCFCGGEVSVIRYWERDGVLVSGLWQCVRDDEHYMEKVEGAPGFTPIREFWHPPPWGGRCMAL